MNQVGPFDESMLLYFSDVDLCKKLYDKGHRILYVAEAEAFHVIGASTDKLPNMVDLYHQDRIIYYRKHLGRAGALACKLALVDLALWEVGKAIRNAGLSKTFLVFFLDLLRRVKRLLRC